MATTGIGFIHDNEIGSIPGVEFTLVGGTYAAPNTPDSGQMQLYFKTDGALYKKDSAGTETLYGSGTGSDPLYRAPVAAVGTSNVTIAAPGANLDGFALTSGDRILLTGQATPSQNGLWTWNGAAAALTRPTDYAAGSTSPSYGLIAFVLNGTAGKYTTWYLTTTGVVTVDTTSTTWAAVGGAQFRGTTEQLRLDYDATHYASFTTNIGGDLTIAPSGGDTTITGTLTVSTTLAVTTSASIPKLSNLITNGFVKTSAGDGTLSIDTNTYLTGNQTITLSGDVSGSGATAITATLATVNSNVGSFAIATVTVNAKGLVTAASAAATTGSGSVVLATSPTIVTPTIASFANASHSHLDAAGGGTLDAAAIAAGTLAAARMPAFTGDITTSAGAVATTLATVNANVGSFAISTITVNGKGLVTAASAAATTGSGSVVLASSPAIVTPTIASFANANHTHQDVAGGGTLDAAAIAAGTLNNGRVNWASPSAIGTGTPAAITGTILTATTNIVSAIWAPSADSTTALKLTKADASTAVVTIDTTNGRVGIGGTPSVPLDITGAVLISTTLGVTGIVTGSASLQSQRAALAITSTDGVALLSSSSATSGVTVRYSPRLRYLGRAWDTAASQTVEFWDEVQPVSAATPSGSLVWSFSLNGAASSSIFQLFSGGAYSGVMDTMTYSGTISLDVKKGNIHKTTTVNATGAATINASSGGSAGQHMWVLVTNDATSGKVITFGTNFLTTGTITGTVSKSATIHFISDGSSWYEVSRTLVL